MKKRTTLLWIALIAFCCALCLAFLAGRMVTNRGLTAGPQSPGVWWAVGTFAVGLALTSLGLVHNFYTNTVRDTRFKDQVFTGSIQRRMTDNPILSCLDDQIDRQYKRLAGFSHSSLEKAAKPEEMLHDIRLHNFSTEILDGMEPHLLQEFRKASHYRLWEDDLAQVMIIASRFRQKAWEIIERKRLSPQYRVILQKLLAQTELAHTERIAALDKEGDSTTLSH